MKKILLGLYFRTRYLFRKILYSIRYWNSSIVIDPSSWVSGRSTIRIIGGGSITIGHDCEIHDSTMILTYGGDISVGDHCSLNPFSIIYGHGGVRIGDGVRIAAHTVIVAGNHIPTVNGEPIYLAGTTKKGIDIDDHVWLGAGSRILDGTTIGRNAIVGAGGVVTKSIPANATVAGVPARIIRQR